MKEKEMKRALIISLVLVCLSLSVQAWAQEQELTHDLINEVVPGETMVRVIFPVLEESPVRVMLRGALDEQGEVRAFKSVVKSILTMADGSYVLQVSFVEASRYATIRLNLDYTWTFSCLTYFAEKKGPTFNNRGCDVSIVQQQQCNVE